MTIGQQHFLPQFLRRSGPTGPQVRGRTRRRRGFHRQPQCFSRRRDDPSGHGRGAHDPARRQLPHGQRPPRARRHARKPLHAGQRRIGRGPCDHRRPGDAGRSARVHQFCRVGRLAMLSGMMAVTQDLPPFCMVYNSRRVGSLNRIGLHAPATRATSGA